MNRLVVGGAVSLCVCLGGAQGATGTLVCPPGTTNPNYCSNVNAPTATSEEAREVTPTSAALTGVVNTYGAATSYRFEYGTTSAYGLKTPEGSLPAAPGQPASATVSSVSATVSGLTPSTTYHFRLVATSAGGTTASADETFTTADEAGLKLHAHTVRVQGNGLVGVPISCVKQPRCEGKLELMAVGHTARASAKRRRGAAHASVYGERSYSLDYGQTATLQVKLDGLAHEVLERHGRLTVELVAVFSDPHTTVVGTLTLLGTRRHGKKSRSKRPPKEITHAEASPGFTG